MEIPPDAWQKFASMDFGEVMMIPLRRWWFAERPEPSARQRPPIFSMLHKPEDELRMLGLTFGPSPSGRLVVVAGTQRLTVPDRVCDSP